MTKLYVGNLPFSATEDQVRALFATHGTVDKVSLVNDRETGRPRGFGFVEMPNADATRAMQALDGKDFGGRPLKVNEAQERERGAPRGNFGGGGGGGGPRPLLNHEVIEIERRLRAPLFFARDYSASNARAMPTVASGEAS